MKMNKENSFLNAFRMKLAEKNIYLNQEIIINLLEIYSSN